MVSSPSANNVTHALRDVKVSAFKGAVHVLSTCCPRAVHMSKICFKGWASRLDLPGNSETWELSKTKLRGIITLGI